MDYLLAGLAFVVAMAALFLASNAQIQDFLTTYLNPIKESNSKNVATAKDLQTKIVTLEKEFADIKERMTRQDEVAGETRENMEKLVRSISAKLK